jgi:hypothetical protein
VGACEGAAGDVELAGDRAMCATEPLMWIGCASGWKPTEATVAALEKGAKSPRRNVRSTGKTPRRIIAKPTYPNFRDGCSILAGSK